MSSKRLLQIAEQIREIISMMIVRGEVADPRVRSVTVTSVKMTPDLQTARIYFSVMGDTTSRESAEKGLAKASGFLRRSIGEALKLRYTPELVFFFDESIERAARIATLLTKIRLEDSEEN